MHRNIQSTEYSVFHFQKLVDIWTSLIRVYEFRKWLRNQGKGMLSSTGALSSNTAIGVGRAPLRSWPRQPRPFAEARTSRLTLQRSQAAMAGQEQGPEQDRPGVLLAAAVSSYLEESLAGTYRLHRLYKAPEATAERKAWIEGIQPEVRAVVGSSVAAASEELVQQLPKLEVVACYSVGTDKVHFPSCKQRGIAVTNTPDVLTDDCADLALALILAALRRIVPADRYLRQGLWEEQGEFPLAAKVGGKRVGIVGLGRIGFAVASRAVAFGCPISYYSRSRKEEADAEGFEFFPTVEGLARACDILVLCCALTPETTGLVDRAVLDALGPKGTLVNIARGPVVEEQELVLALQEGRLGAAGLDVYQDEPRVPKELWGMDNVVLLPHVASATAETRRAMADLVLDNLAAHFAGKPLLTPVQF